ncbi:hypothetical protein Pmani_038092 [Petrolisthes manimaculis]|uniref:Uncharacterized protein n=1 Tax=Petrolisthes manimaculis TaxID=1843537 RepID=A0AAE1NFY8_9EUCA|nr:hypothetical protein Pmani_038092 [Petrolisthes manimaculis]
MVMMPGHVTRPRLLLTLLVLLTLTGPSYTFLWNRIGDEIANEVDDGIIQPLGLLAFGGGTKIVYDMLTYSFLGPLKPAIREAVRTILVDGGGFVLSNLITSIWSLISIIAQLIYWIIDFSVSLSWRIKWDIFSFILGQLNPFTGRDLLNSFVGRALNEFAHSYSAQ